MSGLARSGRSDTLEQVCRPFEKMLHDIPRGLSDINHMSFQSSVRVCLHPRSKTVTDEGNVFLET